MDREWHTTIGDFCHRIECDFKKKPVEVPSNAQPAMPSCILSPVLECVKFNKFEAVFTTAILFFDAFFYLIQPVKDLFQPFFN